MLKVHNALYYATNADRDLHTLTDLGRYLIITDLNKRGRHTLVAVIA